MTIAEDVVETEATDRRSLTLAERSKDKVVRRLQLTLNQRGPAEQQFLGAYDEVYGVAGKRVAGEYVRRCLLVGAALLNGADVDTAALLRQLGAGAAGNIDPADRYEPEEDRQQSVVETTIADNTHSNGSEVLSANESCDVSRNEGAEQEENASPGEAKATGQRVMSGLLGIGRTAEGQSGQ